MPNQAGSRLAARSRPDCRCAARGRFSRPMSTSSFAPESRFFLTDGLPEFRIVMIYEDAAAGRRAQHFCDRLLHALGDGCEDVRNLWSFDVLSITHVRNWAVAAARTADLVIVSVSGKRELSCVAGEWLEMWAWLLDGTNPALLALIEDPVGPGVRSIRTGLRTLAKRKGLDFFAQSSFEPSPALVQNERTHLSDTARWSATHAGRDGAVTMAAQPAEGENRAGCVAGTADRRMAL